MPFEDAPPIAVLRGHAGAKLMHRRCSACGVVSHGELPEGLPLTRCTFGVCQAPLVRMVWEPNLAPVDRRGNQELYDLPSGETSEVSPGQLRKKE